MNTKAPQADLHVKVPADTKTVLEQVAQRDQRSVAWHVRRALERYLTDQTGCR